MAAGLNTPMRNTGHQLPLHKKQGTTSPKDTFHFGSHLKNDEHNKDNMVEEAGVEPATRVEKTQLTDSEIASNAENATISKSAARSLYSLLPELLELPKLHPQTSRL
jgi:hypothetical protein